ncbi:MAG: DUF1622 domain-containing protein [Chlorobiaceae bacterium]
MEPQEAIQCIEFIALSLEILGVIVITLSFFYALVRALLHFRQRREDAYERLKTYMSKALLLGLEFLVAADIISTVLTRRTIQGIASLGLLIIVRTFLGWSLAVEMDGCWPWQKAQNKHEQQYGEHLAENL